MFFLIHCSLYLISIMFFFSVATRSIEGKAVTKGGGICVANHTSPIDVLVLAVDHCYDLVFKFSIYIEGNFSSIF
jgi:1-acyl-sn-glycerol-3-phosphate acyltransferase